MRNSSQEKEDYRALVLSIADLITASKGGGGVIREIYSKMCEENND